MANLNNQTGAATSTAITAPNSVINPAKGANTDDRAGIMIDETKTGASTFYISTNDPVVAGSTGAAPSNTKFSTSSGSNPVGAANESADLISDEQNSSNLLPNKSYNTLDRNMVIFPRFS